MHLGNRPRIPGLASRIVIASAPALCNLLTVPVTCLNAASAFIRSALKCAISASTPAAACLPSFPTADGSSAQSDGPSPVLRKVVRPNLLAPIPRPHLLLASSPAAACCFSISISYSARAEPRSFVSRFLICDFSSWQLNHRYSTARCVIRPQNTSVSHSDRLGPDETKRVGAQILRPQCLRPRLHFRRTPP